MGAGATRDGSDGAARASGGAAAARAGAGAGRRAAAAGAFFAAAAFFLGGGASLSSPPSLLLLSSSLLSSSSSDASDSDATSSPLLTSSSLGGGALAPLSSDIPCARESVACCSPPHATRVCAPPTQGAREQLSATAPPRGCRSFASDRAARENGAKHRFLFLWWAQRTSPSSRAELRLTALCAWRRCFGACKSAQVHY
jgi:hypothetical protein